MTKSIILQRISATAQFVIGFIIGISLIVGVTGSMVFVYYKRMSILPKKPNFPSFSTESTVDDTTNSATEIEPLESNTTMEEEELAVIPEKPEAEAEPEAKPELPANAYYAKVTWPQGLILRAEPSLNAGRVGGIEFDRTIVILEDTSDNKWQRVQLPWSKQEGWVKGGNTKRTSY